MSAPPPRQPGQAAPTPIGQGRGHQTPRARRRPTRRLDTDPAHTPPTQATQPTTRTLRLTSAPPPRVNPVPRPTPLKGSADPRWVLAVRTAELLQGDILTPERRERIVRLGRMFDLTPFDANMIIAIVQDQARRGIAPHLCPTAGEAQLRMITPPKRKTLLHTLKSRYGLTLATLLGAALGIELLLLWWVF